MPGTSTWKMQQLLAGWSLPALQHAYRQNRFLTRNPMVYETLKLWCSFGISTEATCGAFIMVAM